MPEGKTNEFNILQ